MADHKQTWSHLSEIGEEAVLAAVASELAGRRGRVVHGELYVATT
jgi:hypothetical protein